MGNKKKGIFNGEPEAKRSENTIVNDHFDRWAWTDLTKETPDHDKFMEEGEKKIKTVKRLAEDLFYALYKNVPKDMEKERVKTRYWPNNGFVGRMKEMPEYLKLRSHTRLADFESMVGMRAFVKKFLEQMDEDGGGGGGIFGEGEGGDQLEQTLDDLLERQQEIQEQHLKDPGNPDLQNQQKMNDDALKQAQQNLQGFQQDLQDKIDKAMNGMASGIQQSMQEASDKTEELGDFMRGWGRGAGDPSKLPYAQKMALAEKLVNKPAVTELMKIIGRLKRLMSAKQASKLKKSQSEVVDIEQGDSLERMLPSEAVYLMNDELRPLFLRNYTEKKLLQYRLEGKEPARKGPIVCMIDSSGSMSGAPDTWAKGISLALLDLALKQRRNFAAIIFSDRSSATKVIEFKPNDPEAMEKVVEMAEYFIGGGTDFEHPIDKGMEFIEKDKAYKQADLIMLSDGECGVSDDWMARFKAKKKDLDFKFYAILVGSNPVTLSVLCDKVITTNDIKNMETTGELFALV